MGKAVRLYPGNSGTMYLGEGKGATREEANIAALVDGKTQAAQVGDSNPEADDYYGEEFKEAFKKANPHRS